MTKTFYLLAIINHQQKRFDLRIEDDYQGKHTLANYKDHMRKRLANPDMKPHWRHTLWRAVLADEKNCEQLAVVKMDAPDSDTARRIMKPSREAAKKVFREAGYLSYYD